MSRSPITTDPDWLHNAHAGEILASEFMEPLGLEVTDVAAAIGVPARELGAVVDGHRRMYGELDLRLARYFRMSEGFFMRLQDQFELIEAKRALNGALDQIVPRAA